MFFIRSLALPGIVSKPLGALLFLVFISDLERNLQSRIVEVLKFADDSKLICDIGSPEDVEESQKSLEVVYAEEGCNRKYPEVDL